MDVMLTQEELFEWAYTERRIRERAMEILVRYFMPSKSQIVGITKIQKHGSSFIIDWIVNSLPADDIKEMPPIRVNFKDFCDKDFRYGQD